MIAATLQPSHKTLPTIKLLAPAEHGGSFVQSDDFGSGAKLVIWHNPRCTKSRQTLDLLKREGHDPVVRLYLDHGPTEDELRAALGALGIPAISLMRTSEAAFKEQGLSKTDPEDMLITAMSQTPKLIERPVVFHGGKAAIGRPPEAVLDIL